jgi:hypothetical protein
MTPVAYLDSGRTSWLRSTSRLRSYLLTPVVHHDSGRWVCHMSYNLSCERHHMARLDDYSILQLGHLVRSRLGGTYGSFSIWNLSISRLRMFKSQAMCHVTNEHLAQLDLRETRVFRRTRYLATRADRGLQMSGQASQSSMPRDHGNKNWSHLGKILSSTNRAKSRYGWSKTLNALWARRMTPTVLSTKLGITWWKIQTTRVVRWLQLIRTTTSNVQVQETM